MKNDDVFFGMRATLSVCVTAVKLSRVEARSARLHGKGSAPRVSVQLTPNWLAPAFALAAGTNTSNLPTPLSAFWPASWPPARPLAPPQARGFPAAVSALAVSALSWAASTAGQHCSSSAAAALSCSSFIREKSTAVQVTAGLDAT